MRLSGLFASLTAVFFALSCSTDEAGKKGSTINEIDIIEVDHSKDKAKISREECLKLAGVTDLMAQKAEDYTKATGSENGLFNCVYVYSASLAKYADAPEKLAARIALMGFSGVYLSPGSNRLTTADNWLRTFISTCTGLGIEVYATYYEDKSVFLGEVGAESCLQKVISYNRSVNSEERFRGVAADLEPHTIKSDIGLGWVWNTESGNGTGGANENLLKTTISRLGYARKRLAAYGLKLQEAIWWKYQELYNAGSVAYGDVNQFCEVCDWVSIMAYRNSAEKIQQVCEPVFKACRKASSVSVCVKTATNGDISTSLQPNGWSALLETMSSLKAGGHDCLKGLDVFQYDALETMWEWENDKN